MSGKNQKIIIFSVLIIIGIFILFVAFISWVLHGQIYQLFNNKRYIGEPIIIETEKLNDNEYFTINIDLSNGKYHLIINLKPKNIEELRKHHEPILFKFSIEIEQVGNNFLKEYEYYLNRATIGFGPFIIFEIPKDIRNINNINITFKNISINKEYYREIKFILYKSNFKYVTD
jgi:hypothetical protein